MKKDLDNAKLNRTSKQMRELFLYHKNIDPIYSVKSLAAYKIHLGYLLKRKEVILIQSEEGFILSHINKNDKSKPFAYITDIYVEDKRKGSGTRLFDQLMELLCKKNISRVEVAFDVRNNISKSFWKKLGFKTYMERAYIDL